MNNFPIGVFDSGIGGITVLQQLRAILPNEHFIYLSDNARFPYGTKDKNIIADYTKQSLNFFNNLNVKAVVIACNTASAAYLDNLHIANNIKPLIIDIITPSTKIAANISRSQNITILATPATTISKKHEQKILQINPNAILETISAPMLVKICEINNIRQKTVNRIIQYYLNKIKYNNIILGCTHFAILINNIKQLTNNKVNIIDTNKEIAIYTRQLLLNKNMLTNNDKNINNVKFYTTKDQSGFAQLLMDKFDLNIAKDNITKISLV